MKRKTNLFYDAGQDSNFVTFSNYTESLTAVTSSMLTSMFPSKFLCMYIPKLDGEDFQANKTEFITAYLSGYYENKLATLRDYCVETDNIKVEQLICPLKYLLDTVYKYDSESVISFVGDICEQEYNGTFMDNICIIENNAQAIYRKYVDGKDVSDQVSITGEKKDYLHGWENAKKLPDIYKDVVPKYDSPESIDDPEDGDFACIYYPNAKNAHIEEIEGYDRDIKFNVLIPLFTIITTEVVNGKPINEDRPEDLLILDATEYNNQYDTPFGMWFSDKLITLERSEIVATSYRPSWSLCISAQFKPFPYSDKYPNEITDYNNPDKFATFALVLAKQAALLNELSSLKQSIADSRYSNVVYSADAPVETTVTSSQLSYINSRIDELSSKVSNMSFDNINNINSELSASLRRTKTEFNESYEYFLTQSDFIESAYNHFSLAEESLSTFDERFEIAEEHFNVLDERYVELNDQFSYFRDSYGYFVPSTGYFNESYGYYAPSYTYFNDAYKYIVPSYEYFVPTYSYFANEYPYFRQIIAEEHWSEDAYAYAKEAYSSYYLQSYGYFVQEVGYFRPEIGYFRPNIGYFRESYGYYSNSYGYFTSTYNSYLTPAYMFFTDAYQYFETVMAHEWWSHDAYSYMSEAYGTYMMPSYGYFVPQIGYFRPNVGYFREKVGYFNNGYSHFVPSYAYFTPAYQYFTPSYNYFVHIMEETTWFADAYSYFETEYPHFRYILDETNWLEDAYSYYKNSYSSYFMPSYGYFTEKIGFFNRSYDNGIGTFKPSYAYFSTSYNNYLGSYNYFRSAYNQFLTTNSNFTSKYNQFRTDYDRFDSFTDAYDGVRAIYTDFETSYNGFKISYNQFNQEYSSLDERINDVEDENTALRTQVQQLIEELQALTERVEQLEENN